MEFLIFGSLGPDSIIDYLLDRKKKVDGQSESHLSNIRGERAGVRMGTYRLSLDDLCCCCLYARSLKRQPAAGFGLQYRAAVSRYKPLRAGALAAVGFTALSNTAAAFKRRLLQLKLLAAHKWIVRVLCTGGV